MQEHSGTLRDNVWSCREYREYRRIQGNTGEYRGIQDNTGEYRKIKGM